MSWPHHIGETHQPDWVVYVRDSKKFRLTNVIPERIIFVSRGITVLLSEYIWCIRWWGVKKTLLMSDLLQRDVSLFFYIEKWNPFGKMSGCNSSPTFSKLSLYALPIPDDRGRNCYRNVWNLLYFALMFFWKNFVTLTWHFVSTPHVYLTMLSTTQIT